MLEIDPNIRKALKDVGRTEVGRVLVDVFETAKRHYSSINTIDKQRDTNAQIEGRQLMIGFLDEIMGMIVNKKRERRPGELDNFE